MKFIFAILAAVAFSTPALAATAEEEVARYVKIFSGDQSLHSDAADTFAWMGISDTRVCDIVEKRLLEDHQVARNDRHEKNRVARYIRVLGFCGQAKYVPTLNNFVTDGVYERYAKAALEDLPQYQKWNPIIANRATFNPKLSDDANRVMNMLRDDDLMLKRVGAKRVYFQNQEPEVLDLLEKELRANFDKANTRNADAIAWMVKALGHTRLDKYKPLIEEIQYSAKESKVQNHARMVLDEYRLKGSR